MIESQLSYGSEAKKTQLAGAMFFKDDAGKMDAIVVDANANSGFMSRRAKAARSREFEMMGRIHQDIFFQDRYIPNNVKLNLKLIRSRDAFCLMGGAQRKLKITAAKLLVRKVKLSDSVALAHAKALEEATAKFPIKRVVCKPFVIPQGLRDVVQEKLFSGQTPTRLVIGLVENEAFNGSRQKNPFNFQHFNLSEICVYLDGQQGHSIKPLKLDYANGRFLEAYYNLFIGTNKVNRDEGNGIELDDFSRGYALYAYDLTPDLSEGGNFNLIKQGAVRLELRFSDALPAAVTVIAYAEFENLIEIDRSRNVIFDFAS
jgi:hypothetical protein